MRRRLLLVLSRAFLAVACGPTAPQRPVEAPPGSGEGRSLDDAAQARPVFSHCVLHAGELETTKRRASLPGGQPGPMVVDSTCSFNAECVAQQGAQTPGDGFVELQCDSGECSCTLEPLAPPGPALVFRFQAACTTVEQSRQLLLDRCMNGMSLASSPGD